MSVHCSRRFHFTEILFSVEVSTLNWSLDLRFIRKRPNAKFLLFIGSQSIAFLTLDSDEDFPVPLPFAEPVSVPSP